MAAPKQLSNQKVSAHSVNSSIVALHVVQLDSTGGIISGGAGGGSTQVSVREILTSSGASVMDSTNNAVGVTIRAGSAAGTEYTDGDVDASPNFGAVGFDNGSNTMRVVSSLTPLPILGTIYQSTASELNVTVAGYSTTVNVSSLAGAVVVRSSAASALVTAYQSTAADFQATVTPVAGSTWRVQPGSTLWASSAGFHFDSSGALHVNVIEGASAGSTLVTIRQSTFTDLNCRINAPSTANSSNYLPVRITDGSSFISPGAEYSDGSTFSTMTGPGLLFNNSSNQTMRLVGVTQPLPAQIRTSSGGDISDSTERAIRVNVVAGSAAGSTEATVRQSTYTDFNTLSRLADRDASTRVAGVLNALQPASTTYGLVVRMPAPFADSTESAIRVNVVAGAAGGSTEMTVRQSTVGALRAAVYQSTAADLNVTVAGYVAPSTTVNVSSLAGAVITRSSAASMLATVYQSTAADLNVTVAGYSTTVNVSSLGGAVIVRSSAANHLVSVYQSTASELQVTATQNSTAWSVLSRVTTSSGGGVEGSTTAPAVGVTGLHVRQVFPTLLSTTLEIISTHSTAIYPIVSSAAGLRHKVFAYFVSSTHTNPSTLIFCSSASNSGFDHWHVGFGSGSSGITGANLAVTPPGFLFAGIAQNALNVKIEGGSSVTSTVIARIAISYFTEA